MLREDETAPTSVRRGLSQNQQSGDDGLTSLKLNHNPLEDKVRRRPPAQAAPSTAPAT